MNSFRVILALTGLLALSAAVTLALADGHAPVPVPPPAKVVVAEPLAAAPQVVRVGDDAVAAQPVTAAVTDGDLTADLAVTSIPDDTLGTGQSPASAPDSTLAAGRTSASEPDSTLVAQPQAGQATGYLPPLAISMLGRQIAKAMYDPASRPDCYAAMLAPLPQRAGLAAPVKAHGWYWFHHQAITDDRLARCQAAYARMKATYPLPCVIVNHELLSDPAGAKKLMALFGEADVLLWVDANPSVIDAALFANFLAAYGQHVGGVILGHYSMMAGTRERLGQADPRVTASDGEVWNFWGGLVRHALPGRSLLWTWHHHQPGRQGFAYNAKMLPQLAGLNLDGLCVWGFPGALLWSGKAGDDLAALPKQWFDPSNSGKNGLFIIGDWAVSTTLLWPTVRTDTPQFAVGAKTAVQQIAPCEAKILPLGGAVRFIGRIPDSYRVLEDLAK